MTPEEREAVSREMYAVLFTSNYCIDSSWERIKKFRDGVEPSVALERVANRPDLYPELFDAVYIELLTMRLEGVITWPSKTERCSST